MDGTTNSTDLPGDFASFDELKEDYPDLSIADWKALAEGINVPIQRFRLSSGIAIRKTIFGINWQDVEKIEEAYRVPEAGADVLSGFKLAREFRMRRQTLIDLADKHSVQHSRYSFPNSSRGEGFHRDLHDVLREIVIREKGTDFEDDTRRDQLENIPPNCKSFQLHARSRKMKETTLLELCDGAKVIPKEYLVRGKPTACLSEEQIGDLEKAYDPELMKKVVPISIREFASQNRSNAKEMLSLAKAAGIHLKKYYFGSRENYGITPDEIDALDAAYEGQPRAPFSTEDISIFGVVAEEEGIDYRTMRKLFAGTDIEVGVYRFPNGKDLPGLNRDQIDALKTAYAPFPSASAPASRTI